MSSTCKTGENNQRLYLIIWIMPTFNYFYFCFQGHSQPYKTVNAKALEDSQVIKLPMRAFQEVFKEYPDIFVRVIQVSFIM